VLILFTLIIVLLIVADLFLFHRGSREISIKEALLTSGVWIGLALLFNIGIYYNLGKEPALNFLAGYLIEKMLSIDNLFVFVILFQYFHTPKQYQHKVLFWGIIGAIAMRGVMIFVGLALVERFEWIIYVFGAFLVYTGIKMALPEEPAAVKKSKMFQWLEKWIPVTPNYHGSQFFVRQSKKWLATPLFIALVAVELTDFVFAIDSIPAVIAITQDPFIVYTSNIFAILGLRSLFFALSGILKLFHFLNYGLAIILTFVGIKMLIHSWYEVPTLISLLVISITLTISILASIVWPKK